MILAIYTLIHVAISLVGILSGGVVLFGLFAGKKLNGWTALFLTTTILTSLTGFFFPTHHIMPSHIIGLLSLVVLGLALYARYPKQLAGGWRTTYVINAMLALYLNVFVAVVQAFMKVSALKALAPTQSEPPFKVIQLIVLISFIFLTIIATIRFRKVAAQLSNTPTSDHLP